MRMVRMTKDYFLSFILDKRKTTIKNSKFEAYYHNPLDARGNPSSFVMVVVIGGKFGEVYCGVSKYNTEDTRMIKPEILPGTPEKQIKKMKPVKVASGFSMEEGLKQACNRAWREMHVNMPSLYGRAQKSTKNPPVVNRINSLIRELLVSTTALPSPFRPPLIWGRPPAQPVKKLIAANSKSHKEAHVTKKGGVPSR